MNQRITMVIRFNMEMNLDKVLILKFKVLKKFLGNTLEKQKNPLILRANRTAVSNKTAT